MVADLKVLGHLLLEDFLEDSLHALANPGLHVQLHVVVEFMFRGQVVSLLTQPTTYQSQSTKAINKNQAPAEMTANQGLQMRVNVATVHTRSIKNKK